MSDQGRTLQRWLLAVGLLAWPAVVVLAASCSSTTNGEGPPLGAGGALTTSTSSGCVGPSCTMDCAAHPHPGCACDVQGQHLVCGKTEESEQGQAVCGKGISVCNDGVWQPCIIDNAVTLTSNAPPGYYADNFGAPSMCASNPCDPTCDDYKDTPVGINETDGGVEYSDGGDGGTVGITLLPGDGGSQCVPKTCAAQGLNCGPASDLCGTLLNCGSCSLPQTCGGTGTTGVCGTPSTCTNLCLLQQTCTPNTVTTTLKGRVFAPNGVDPLPNAVVYIPNSQVTAFSAGVACEQCGEPLAGNPIVQTTTDVTGSFTLTNVPVGANIPLVIQIGRWRRVFGPAMYQPGGSSALATANELTISGLGVNLIGIATNLFPCGTFTIPDGLLKFPSSHIYGDIPLMAFDTGSVDSLECVWRKIGIADSEFTNPGGSGRINFFEGQQSGGAYINGSTPAETSLVGNTTTLNSYDMVLFPCQGAEYYYTNTTTESTYQANLTNYANAGGRIFTTHFNYGWIYKDNVHFFSGLSGAINWSINGTQPSPDPQTGYIDTTFTDGQTLAQWLKNTGLTGTGTYGQIPLSTLRHDFTSGVSPTQRWTYLANGTPMHVTFNTPVGAQPSSQCGRVVYSDFHVENASNSHTTFPNECSGAAMTAQEKLLEYMLFDLASCIPTQPVCVPKTCAQIGLNCGPANDGCNNTIQCGSCTLPATCGGGGTTGVCGTPATYTDGYFTRDYDASTLCQSGYAPVWRLYSWTASTPLDSHIDFTIQTASTSATLSSAPQENLLFDTTWPMTLQNTQVIAKTANGTTAGSTSPDYSLQKANQVENYNYLRVTAHLVPSSNKLSAPTLMSWDMQVDCQPIQ